MHGGASGAPGLNLLVRDGRAINLGAKCSLPVRSGDMLCLNTPGMFLSIHRVGPFFATATMSICSFIVPTTYVKAVGDMAPMERNDVAR
jgi:hypothetical protein